MLASMEVCLIHLCKFTHCFTVFAWHALFAAQLLSEGADPDMKCGSRRGRTPLIISAEFGHLRVVSEVQLVSCCNLPVHVYMCTCLCVCRWIGVCVRHFMTHITHSSCRRVRISIRLMIRANQRSFARQIRVTSTWSAWWGGRDKRQHLD